MFDWRAYLRLAEHLAGHTDAEVNVEASLRSAISRSYYAVFCVARNAAQTHGASFSPQTNVHREVQRYYEGLRSREARHISSSLSRLRRQRNIADYENRFRGDLSQQAASVIDTAQRALAVLSRFF